MKIENYLQLLDQLPKQFPLKRPKPLDDELSLSVIAPGHHNGNGVDKS